MATTPSDTEKKKDLIDTRGYHYYLMVLKIAGILAISWMLYTAPALYAAVIFVFFAEVIILSYRIRQIENEHVRVVSLFFQFMKEQEALANTPEQLRGNDA